MNIIKCYLINNDCYSARKTKIVGQPYGIVVHSTGANNVHVRRYVQPVCGQENFKELREIIGVNTNSNHWNYPCIEKCVHAFIGKIANGSIATVNTLPYDLCAWGVGNGSKGSYNWNPKAHIQFEICEDNLTDRQYFNAVMKEAQEYCAYLCKEFAIPVERIISHHESYLQGYGCNHGDIDHWLKQYNLDMNWFRGEVSKLIVLSTKDDYIKAIVDKVGYDNPAPVIEAFQKLEHPFAFDLFKKLYLSLR